MQHVLPECVAQMHVHRAQQMQEKEQHTKTKRSTNPSMGIAAFCTHVLLPQWNGKREPNYSEDVG